MFCALLPLSEALSMAEDTRQPGEEKKSEPTQAGQRSAADDDLDIDIDSAPVRVQGGGGGMVWLFLAIIVVLAVVAFFGYKYYETWRAEQEAEALAQRIESYEAKMATIATNIAQAAASARAGNLEDALTKLDNAEENLTRLGAEANGNNDQQWAAIATKKKDAVIAAKKALEGYRTTVEDQFGSLETVFGIRAEGEPAEGTQPAEGAEGIDAGTAAEPEQPAAGAETPGAAAPAVEAPEGAAPAADTPEAAAAEQPGDAAAPEQPAPAPEPVPGG